MARIVLAELGVPFDGRTMHHGPLGGTETAVALLAEALAGRGHAVRCLSNIDGSVTEHGVRWTPPPDAPLSEVDLFIASRSPLHFRFAPGAPHKVLWVHNPARYLRRFKNLPAIWTYRPHVVLLGDFHRSTLPRWLPFASRHDIAHAPEPEFRTSPTLRPPPPPRAIFCSNPLRSLDWLLSLWQDRIHPRVRGAQLHLYTGAKTYGGTWNRKMAPVLRRAARLRHDNVFLHEPVPKHELGAALRSSRVMLYRGDPGETFCLVAAEAQEVGLPLVTRGVGALGERVVDGVTGILARNDRDFAEAAVTLLSDNRRWLDLHGGALKRSGRRSWADVAADFERFLDPP